MTFIRRLQPVPWIAVFWAIAFRAVLLADDQAAIDIGDRRELFVDSFLLDRLDGVELRLHSPAPHEVVMVCDAAWEGSGCGYETVFRDGPVIRMYYIAADLTSADGTKMASRPLFACYAESQDGIRWVKPDLGLFEFGGSKHNNIVWSGPSLDNFTPMKFHPRYGTAVTDGLFMSSRDGQRFYRFDQAFLRPGLERRDNWVYGDCYQSLGLLETPAADPTAPPELTFYVGEDHWKGPNKIRRYTLRMDGFASLSARSRGEFVTKLLTFRGKELTLNFSSSAAGHVRVELQDAVGRPLPGFGLADSDELFGDTLQRVVTWGNKSDVSALAGRPIRLRMALRDADIYSLRFQP